METVMLSKACSACSSVIASENSCAVVTSINAGIRPVNPCDHHLLLPSPAVNKIPSRQRWTPTSKHLEILERLSKECNSSPGRQKIKEITAELIRHGEISETNVNNWFQNRRASSKRKQPSTVPSTSESGGDRNVVSAKEKLEAEDMQPDEDVASIINIMHFQCPEIGIDQVIGKMESPKRYWQVKQHDLVDASPTRSLK